MRSTFLAPFSLACLLAASLTPPAPAQPAATVYEGARLITGDGSAPITDSAFLVENGRFTAVGRKGQIKLPAGAAHVDLTGKTVMPAIVDAHKHLSVKRDELVDQLQHLAYYGIGAAMSLGQDTGDAAFQVRAETIPNAARLHTAGRGITAPEPGRTQAPYWVKTEAEARKAVQEDAAKKVDIIKIWVDDRDHTVTKLSPELYRAVIDEAHKHHLRTIAHIYYLDDAKGVLRAGIDAFAHSVRDKDIDDEFLQMMKAKPGIIVDPNLPDRGVRVDRTWLRDGMPAAEFQKIQAESKNDPKAQQFFGIQSRNLAKLNANGIKIALGTDGPIPWAAHEEMADMVASGMTPAQVIVASTRNSAELMGLADAGTVAARQSADFLVLDANPLDDITNTRRINAVYLRGAKLDRAALRAKWVGGSSN
ncbi:MAG TPA: amidohydrolase family protein [Bryobacteraceae bacterium]|nr:amidohydrolase family protein [Bryobacteraceae bacterium]